MYDDACSSGAPTETLHIESDDAIALNSNGVTGIFITTNGKVGIGTTSP